MPDHPNGRLIATLTLDLYRGEAGRVTFIPDINVRGDDPHAEDANLRLALLCLVEQLGRRASPALPSGDPAAIPRCPDCHQPMQRLVYDDGLGRRRAVGGRAGQYLDEPLGKCTPPIGGGGSGYCRITRAPRRDFDLKTGA